MVGAQKQIRKTERHLKRNILKFGFGMVKSLDFEWSVGTIQNPNSVSIGHFIKQYFFFLYKMISVKKWPQFKI